MHSIKAFTCPSLGKASCDVSGKPPLHLRIVEPDAWIHVSHTRWVVYPVEPKPELPTATPDAYLDLQQVEVPEAEALSTLDTFAIGVTAGPTAIPVPVGPTPLSFASLQASFKACTCTTPLTVHSQHSCVPALFLFHSCVFQNYSIFVPEE